MPLVINAFGGGHTDRHTHTYRHANQNNFKKPGVLGPYVITHMMYIPFKIFLPIFKNIFCNTGQQVIFISFVIRKLLRI